VAKAVSSPSGDSAGPLPHAGPPSRVPLQCVVVAGGPANRAPAAQATAPITAHLSSFARQVAQFHSGVADVAQPELDVALEAAFDERAQAWRQPKARMSARLSTGRPLACSDAM
jgi:hypothetical protein